MTSLTDARRVLESYGATLAVHRRGSTVSLRDLADQIGVRADELSRIERGVLMPSVEQERILSEWMLQHRVSRVPG